MVNRLAITKSVTDFLKGIRKMLSDPVGALILMMPLLLILFVAIVIFLVYKRSREEYRPYSLGKAVAPEETQHYRMTDPDYRENDKRDDIVDLKDKMSEFLFDGMDNWDKNGQGWWGDVIQNKNNPGIYARKDWIWPD